jgi:arginine/serine-rich splicing factor 2
MPVKSRYTLLVEGLSSATRSGDLKKAFESCGTVYEVERDSRSRSALVEMKRSDDAEYAWKKMEGYRMDGRKWRVDYATKDDYKFFGWKWTEGGDKDRSPSRSASRSPSPSR